MSARLYVITGCSGGGKSTLIEALATAGQHVVREPGRRIIAAGGPMPWDDLEGFARAAISMAETDYVEAKRLSGPVFFDRGLIDAVFALAHATDTSPDLELIRRHPYEGQVFYVPPWPEIYATDADRRHGFTDALAEWARLEEAYISLGHSLVPLEQGPVAERVEQILTAIGGGRAEQE